MRQLYIFKIGVESDPVENLLRWRICTSNKTTRA